MSEKGPIPPGRSLPSEGSPAGPWRVRPVFISSTFKDMHAERDWLRARVFPRLEEELSRRRCHLEMIDLRLGVETARAETEEARELLVLKVCLDEIRRSRPFLLVLLGDRYGWVPDEDRMASAAREQGFEISPSGKSVTALEIEFGILKEDPTQKHRSLFFFRRPLPYDQMPEDRRAVYSDAHSPDPQVRVGHDRLVALKDRLRNDPELGRCVFEYELGWDGAAAKVTRLGAFGDLVSEKLWALLDDETRAFAARPPATPDEQERAALAEFIEHRSRIFIGREDVLRQLLNTARRKAVDGPATSMVWCGLLVGSPGSGKSAVFAQVYRELERGDRRTLLLANAAGGTPRGSRVEAMLRRWTAELAAAAGMADPLSEKALTNEIETKFYDLLKAVAEQRRVVALIDGLEQFEPTRRGQHLTWLDVARWPSNARLIATGLPCPAADVLSQQPGVERVQLPPLTASDAAELGELVWRRYHRELNPGVLRILMDKKLAGEPPAWQNPLWLTLALEQINLLDAVDFARAERDAAGSPARLAMTLLYDAALQIPADIGGLYGLHLKQNERAFGAAHARGFAVALALSRSGWREIDLLKLVPRLGRVLFPETSSEPLDDLSLSALRRGFRAHIIRRGENGLIDFAYAQTRRGMLQRCAPNAESRPALHAAINDYLVSLPSSDPLVEIEQVRQLIGERNALRAARFYAALDESSEAGSRPVSATARLVEWIAAGEADDKTNANLEWVTSWLDAPGLAPEEVYHLSGSFQRLLLERMENICGLDTQYAILDAVDTALRRLVKVDPSNSGWRYRLSRNHALMGDALLKKGNLPRALEAYRRYQAEMQRLAEAEPTHSGWQDELAVSYCKMGGVLFEQGDLAGALFAYRESHAVAKRLAESKSSGSSWPRVLAESQRGIGDALLAQGDLTAAAAFQESLAAAEGLAESDPTDPSRQHELLLSHGKIGAVLLARGDSAGALDAYRKALAVAEHLAECDPSNTLWQTDLAVIQRGMGEAFLAADNRAEALLAYDRSLAAAERAMVDPSNVRRQHDLAHSYYLVGRLREYLDFDGAYRAYRKYQAVMKRLAAVDPFNTGWKNDLAAAGSCCDRLFNMMFNFAGGIDVSWQSLDDLERQSGLEPTNAHLHRDLFLMYWREAYMTEKSGVNAEEWWRKACGQLSALKKLGVKVDPGEKFFQTTKEP